jgi:hypothetical protein
VAWCLRPGEHLCILWDNVQKQLLLLLLLLLLQGCRPACLGRIHGRLVVDHGFEPCCCHHGVKVSLADAGALAHKGQQRQQEPVVAL